MLFLLLDSAHRIVANLLQWLSVGAYMVDESLFQDRIHSKCYMSLL